MKLAVETSKQPHPQHKPTPWPLYPTIIGRSSRTLPTPKLPGLAIYRAPNMAVRSPTTSEIGCLTLHYTVHPGTSLTHGAVVQC